MSSKRAAIDPDVVYRSNQALRQQEFPRRSSNVKRIRGSLPTASKPKLGRQSTLTQRWTLGGGGSDVEDVEDIEHDESSVANFDEDEVSKADKPRRKKRKTTPSTKKKFMDKRQNTMTQMGFVTSFESDYTDQDGDFEVPDTQQEDEEDRVPESVSSQNTTVASKNATKTSSLEKSTSITKASPRSRQEPSPDLSVPLAQPRTPRRNHGLCLEVPSSITPQSALLSPSRRQTERSPSNSPSKRRSQIIPRSPIEASARENALDTAIPSSHWPVTKVPLFRKPDLPLKRKPVSSSNRSGMLGSDDMPIGETQYQAFVPSTIQDSQFGALGQEITESTNMGLENEISRSSGGGYQATMEFDYMRYDPAASALDRDAARYDQTQRLINSRRNLHPDIIYDTQEGSAEDLLAAGRQASHRATGFTSLQKDPHPLSGETPGDVTSMKSESLPSTPEVVKRSHHRPRFRNAEVIDLTADSFEYPVPTIPGSPTPRTESQVPVDIYRLISSQSPQRTRQMSSSPPLVPRDRVIANEDVVEYLPLNDVGPRLAFHDALTALPIPPSQVSTVVDSTQAWFARTKIKHEPEDVYSATNHTLRAPTEESDLDLDNDDEYIDIDETVLPEGEDIGIVEHMDLSDQPDPPIDNEEEGINILDVHRRHHIGKAALSISSSSPFPIPPGHVAAEYEDIMVDEEEIVTSDLPSHITSPPATDAEMSTQQVDDGGSGGGGVVDSQSSQTSLGTHRPFIVTTTLAGAKEEDEEELTPRPARSARPPPPPLLHSAMLSEKARGKLPMYRTTTTINDSEDEYEDDDDDDDGFLEEFDAEQDERGWNTNRGADEVEHEDLEDLEEQEDQEDQEDQEEPDQYSYRFRPAREIVPDDTQLFSLGLPPIPSSSSPGSS